MFLLSAWCLERVRVVAESRAKFETEQKLKVNQAEQRALNEAALQQELDLRQKKIDQKITVQNLATDCYKHCVFTMFLHVSISRK